jgi:hypothetical protein
MELYISRNADATIEPWKTRGKDDKIFKASHLLLINPPLNPGKDENKRLCHEIYFPRNSTFKDHPESHSDAEKRQPSSSTQTPW